MKRTFAVGLLSAGASIGLGIDGQAPTPAAASDLGLGPAGAEPPADGFVDGGAIGPGHSGSGSPGAGSFSFTDHSADGESGSASEPTAPEPATPQDLTQAAIDQWSISTPPTTDEPAPTAPPTPEPPAPGPTTPQDPTQTAIDQWSISTPPTTDEPAPTAVPTTQSPVPEPTTLAPTSSSPPNLMSQMQAPDVSPYDPWHVGNPDAPSAVYNFDELQPTADGQGFVPNNPVQPDPAQVSLTQYLTTPEGARQLKELADTEYDIHDDADWQRAIDRTAGKLRDISLAAPPLTDEQTRALFPAPTEQEIEGMPPADRLPALQRLATAEEQRLSARYRDGISGAELGCVLVCDETGRAEALGLVIGTDRSVSTGLDVTGTITNPASVAVIHTHSLRKFSNEGLSDGDRRVPVHLVEAFEDLDPANAGIKISNSSVHLLSGTVVTGSPDPTTNRWGEITVSSANGTPVSDKIRFDDRVLRTRSPLFELAPGTEIAAEGTSDTLHNEMAPHPFYDSLRQSYGSLVERLRGVGSALAGRDPVPAPSPSAEDASVVDAPARTPADGTSRAGDPEPRTPGGATYRPEPGLTPQEQTDLGLIRLPGDRANDPPQVQPRDLDRSGRGGVDPAEFDPNRSGVDVPVVPGVGNGSGVRPQRPDREWEKILNGGLFTFPTGHEESTPEAGLPEAEATPAPLGIVSSPALVDELRHPRVLPAEAESSETGRAGPDLGRWVSDLWSGPATMTRSRDGKTYSAAWGVPLTSTSKVGVYDAVTGELVAAEKGDPPPRVDTAQHLDPGTGAALAALGAAAVPGLAAELLLGGGSVAAGPGTVGSLAAGGGLGAVLPALPGYVREDRNRIR